LLKIFYDVNGVLQKRFLAEGVKLEKNCSAASGGDDGYKNVFTVAGGRYVHANPIATGPAVPFIYPYGTFYAIYNMVAIALQYGRHTPAYKAIMQDVQKRIKITS